MQLLKVALASIPVLAIDSFLIYFAYFKKQQFYPAMIYLLKTRIFLTLFLVQILGTILYIAYNLAKLFFGRFQRIELDNLVSRYWFAFVDVCLIFASFQEELSISFLFTFTFLMIVKGFHWLLEDRIDYMQITPEIRSVVHLRVLSLLFLLSAIDLSYVRYLFFEPIRHTELVRLAIGTEYCVLLFSLISTVIRYTIYTIDSRRSSPWDEKRMYILITDVFIALSKLLVYLSFLTSLWRFHPLPLFLVRPIYLSLRFLTKSLQDLYLSRRAIQYMNNVFKDATAEDFSSSNDKTCIICLEEMAPVEAPAESNVDRSRSRANVKKLPCGHMFHFFCLRDWFLTHQNCPTCRHDVITPARPNNSAPVPQRQPEQVQSQRPNIPTPPTMPQFVGIQQEQATGHVPIFMPIILPGTAFSTGTFIPSPIPNPPEDLNGSYIDENALKSSVEARLAALRQVQTLLDAAMLQMNAYVSATSSSSSENVQ
ncbi:E3 ubiquitin-protein ligase synoviolin [Cichlidogyrus casuarinus]|uniref:RING-type E3 ubiquitin transferase n=1 Tax=Cichlidogyrus casuarinus TaxID=1844966 RepID=A0ABD2Q8K9_9PLAT